MWNLLICGIESTLPYHLYKLGGVFSSVLCFVCVDVWVCIKTLA